MTMCDFYLSQSEEEEAGTSTNENSGNCLDHVNSWSIINEGIIMHFLCLVISPLLYIPNRINNSQTGAEKYKSHRVIYRKQTLCGGLDCLQSQGHLGLGVILWPLRVTVVDDLLTFAVV